MDILSEQEETFLTMYLSANQNAGRQGEIYKLAFGDQAKGLSDSSASVYARKLLAKPESKRFLSDRKIGSSTAAFELLETLAEVNRILETEDLKPAERIGYFKEKRLTLADIRKSVIIEPDRQTQKHLISDSAFAVNLGKFEELEEDEFKDILELTRAGKFVTMRDGEVIVLTVFNKNGSKNSDLREAIENGCFSIAIENASD